MLVTFAGKWSLEFCGSLATIFPVTGKVIKTQEEKVVVGYRKGSWKNKCMAAMHRDVGVSHGLSN